jgi:hypothetical protein
LIGSITRSFAASAAAPKPEPSPPLGEKVRVVGDAPEFGAVRHALPADFSAHITGVLSSFVERQLDVALLPAPSPTVGQREN